MGMTDLNSCTDRLYGYSARKHSLLLQDRQLATINVHVNSNLTLLLFKGTLQICVKQVEAEHLGVIGGLGARAMCRERNSL